VPLLIFFFFEAFPLNLLGEDDPSIPAVFFLIQLLKKKKKKKVASTDSRHAMPFFISP
jgi:hypothetical protein